MRVLLVKVKDPTPGKSAVVATSEVLSVTIATATSDPRHSQVVSERDRRDVLERRICGDVRVGIGDDGGCGVPNEGLQSVAADVAKLDPLLYSISAPACGDLVVAPARRERGGKVAIAGQAKVLEHPVDGRRVSARIRLQVDASTADAIDEPTTDEYGTLGDRDALAADPLDVHIVDLDIRGRAAIVRRDEDAVAPCVSDDRAVDGDAPATRDLDARLILVGVLRAYPVIAGADDPRVVQRHVEAGVEAEDAVDADRDALNASTRQKVNDCPGRARRKCDRDRCDWNYA